MGATNINAIYKENIPPIMDGSAPVLKERKEIKTWKRLTALEKAAAKGSKKNVEKLRKIIQSILDSEDYANPMIVVKLIDLVDLYLSDELQDIMLEVLEKCKLTDCAPQLQAADKLLRIGSYDSAKFILDRMTVVSDVPEWEFLRGIVDIHDGNTKSAYRHFSHVYDLDDRFLAVYNELEQLEPDKGWFSRGMIAQILNDDIPSSHTSSSDGRYGDLYNAYWEWKNGSRSSAMDLVGRIVREGIETDVELATARFYAGEKKYTEAIEHYLKAAESGKFFIKLELAETCWISGNYDDAFAVCSELEGRGISDRRLIDLQVRIATKKQDRQGLVKYVKIYLYGDYADYEAYARCAKAYIELRMHSEASSLLEDMSIMESDDPEINLLLSKNDYASGRYPSARVAAKKAVRKMPNDIDCLLHISRVYMSMKRPEKALKYLDNILEEDDRHRAALLLKKEIYMSMSPPEYEKAKIQCEKIITHYPDDSETLKDLAVVYAKMGKDKESLNAYRRSLDIKKDPVLFMDIITTLARSGKFEDAVDLTNDYETTYGNMVDMWAIRGNAEYQTGDYEAAIRSYTRAVDMDHNRPVLWHSRGMAEEAAGEYDLAEISYDKAVLMDLDNSEYWISKAAVQEKKGDYSGAINSLNRVISTHPENVYSLMRKAMILNRLGKNSEARTFIELASKIDPINMKIMVARRDIYSLEGDTEATKAICNNILSINPNDKKTAIILARMNIKTGNLDDARNILVEQNIDTPFSDEDYEIHQMLREIYHIQGKTHEEISTCKTILQYRPDDRDTKAALAEAYIKRGMIDAAKAIYDELHVLSPEDSNFSLKKADMADDRESALSYLMESLNKDPDNKDVLIRLSRMMYEDGMTEDGMVDKAKMKDSLIYANRAIEADPTDSRAYVCKITVLYTMNNFSGVLETVDEAASNVKYKDPLIWKYGGDAQMMLRDYSNALILYDTAMKLGISTREIYFYRGMCQEALGKYDEAINSYTVAYQKEPEDIESMLRAAGAYLTLEKDQSAGRVLDQAISIDPMFSEAIIARATIFASRSNEGGVKRLFDHCVQHGVDEETKQIVAELMEKARNKEVVAMPIIPLVMPDVPEEKFDHDIGRGTRGEPHDEGEEQSSKESSDDDEDQTPREPPAAGEEPPPEETPEGGTEGLSEEESLQEESVSEDGFDQIDEIPAVDEETSEEEPEEESLEDGFFIDEEPEQEDESQQESEEPKFQTMEEETEAETEEQTSEEHTEGSIEEISAEEELEETPVAEEPEPEEPVTEETFADDETEAVFFADDEEESEPEPEEEPDVDIEEEPIPEPVPVEEPEPEIEEQTIEEEPEVVPAPVPEPEAEQEVKEEPEPRKSVQEYAIDLLRYAHEHGEMPSEEEAAELAGIPSDMVKEVLECLSDIEEYGKIDPSGGEFKRMEEMSFRAIVNTGADDIEEDPVISLTSALFDSGANDLDTAKRLVAYVYEAMTCSIDGHAIYDQISEIADDVEFHGSPTRVFEIMSKYHIGAYSARAVQSLAFNKDGQ